MYMLQQAALLALLILVTYAVLTKAFEKPTIYASQGNIVPNTTAIDTATATATPTIQMPQARPIGIDGPHASNFFDKETPAGHGLDNLIGVANPLDIPNDGTKLELTSSHLNHNINQFYKENPEIFNRGPGTTHTPDGTEWERQSNAMFSAQQGGGQNTVVEPYNFEDKWSPLS